MPLTEFLGLALLLLFIAIAAAAIWFKPPLNIHPPTAEI
jgi:hypothetical protein